MDAVTVRGLCKHYDGFALRDVSFTLPEGTITGFIGRNGAGKTTTLKAMLQFLHPDGGEVRFFGRTFAAGERDSKAGIGYVSGGADFYPRQRLRTITGVCRRFYPQWDETTYRKYLELFRLDERKTPAALSAGMRVKYALALALSHRARLLLLDEPTSGLDPVSRDELLDVFRTLVEEEGVTLFFSTHITSDLDRCADRIVYLRDGVVLAVDDLDRFAAGYRLARLAERPAEPGALIGLRQERHGWTGLLRAGDAPPPGAELQAADLETIMIHLEREGRP